MEEFGIYLLTIASYNKDNFSHLLEEMRPRNFVELVLIDDLHCDLFAGENVPCQLYYGKVAAAESLLQVVEPGDLAIVIAVSYSSIHVVSLKCTS